ncbi:metallophosphoesterase [Sinorhizobium meliloti]|uniref:metallophosphoesterase n=1 Tax=Rhizobium meliloti TaxID=382 RepID=UPI003D653286
MQGALDPADPERLLERADLTKILPVDEDGNIWIDFVADIGDGFDETYAVAYMLAQKHLGVKGVEHALPRGSVLIIGGDLVYPTASREIYKEKMRRPYSLAQPDNEADGAFHPRLFAIPGNHDWYDGLAAFYGTFCRALDRKPYHDGLSIGNWRCRQYRSYFALQLPHDWWVWGVDIQLSGFIDEPQVNYFRLIADSLPDDAKIIICTATPSWLNAVEYGDSQYDSINYIARIAQGEVNGGTFRAKRTVKVIISGDLHHYSRYEAPDGSLHLVTAGGGGAFAHSTHSLPYELPVPDIYIDIKAAAPDHHRSRYRLGGDGAACYPTRAECRRLLWRNLWFGFKNWDFSLGLGAIYWIVSWFFASHEGGALFEQWSREVAKLGYPLVAWPKVVFSTLVTSPVLAFLVASIYGALFYYVGTRRRWLQIPVGFAHATSHLAAFLALAFLFRHVNAKWLGLDLAGPLAKILFAAEMVLIGGFIGGSVFGIYFVVTSKWLNIHGEEAFGALRIGDYRNFLRMKLSAEALTIFPVGLASVPSRDGWRINPSAKSGLPASRIEPVESFEPFLIEPPIVICAGPTPSARQTEEQPAHEAAFPSARCDFEPL